mmetsp:Transcript_4421/g.6474  ORF Transcript_4421/g.6474 Transcript_4421/m.6474 type:complete len:216 (-) Transcript_4421:93-740(-)
MGSVQGPNGSPHHAFGFSDLGLFFSQLAPEFLVEGSIEVGIVGFLLFFELSQLGGVVHQVDLLLVNRHFLGVDTPHCLDIAVMQSLDLHLDLIVELFEVALESHLQLLNLFNQRAVARLHLLREVVGVLLHIVHLASCFFLVQVVLHFVFLSFVHRRQQVAVGVLALGPLFSLGGFHLGLDFVFYAVVEIILGQAAVGEVSEYLVVFSLEVGDNS